jgi:glycerophosphoryl diester phosphodiesterase
MKKNREITEESGLISYGRLVFEAIPEIFSFQIFSSIVLGILAWAVRWLITLVAESGGAAITTANLKDLLLSWRGPVILVLGVILVAVFAVLEIFASLHLYDDILRGRNVRLRSEVGRGFVSLRHFANPFGILILLYIFIAVPLCGVGFSISLTEGFYIPNFIMEVVRAKTVFNVGYWIVIAALAVVGLGGVFTLHGVVIDGKKPLQAFKDSFRLWKDNWKNFVPVMLLTLLVIIVLIVGFVMLNDFWMQRLEAKGAMFPTGHQVDYRAVFNGEGSDLDAEMMVYRCLCALVVLGGGFMTYLLTLTGGSYLMLRLTRCYLEYTRDDLVKWPSRSKRRGYLAKLVLLILILVLIFVFAAVVGVGFDDIFHRDEPVRIVAHRTGGVMAPENSMEGLEIAIEHGCYAAETDTQRTKDGYYIINHDDDFKRLTGVKKKPGEMTLEEVRGLVITDPTTGATSDVPELDEMLDAVKDRILLFLELKGATADKQMVDDVVKMIREKDCVDDVVLISLKYDIIDYAETQYPEFATGVLIFGGLGDVSRINSDLLILEEEMATPSRIDSIHNSGKEVYVWTINTEMGMYDFLDSKCDGIITDQIEMAERVQETLDNRTDMKLLQDKLGDVWN